MTLFGSLLANTTKSKPGSSVIDEDLAKMQIEAQSRHEGVENMRESTIALSTLLGTRLELLIRRRVERQVVPCLQSLAKAMIQQGKFYQEGTDYARQLVSIGQSFLERAEEEAILVPGS